MSSFSNAGTYKAFPLIDTTSVMPTGDGFAFSIALVNTTGAAITAGTVQFQGTGPDPLNVCNPDAAGWADLMVNPACDAPNGSVAGIAGVTLSAALSIPARGQIHLSWPCNEQFLRLKANPPAGVSVIGIVTQLRDQ